MGILIDSVRIANFRAIKEIEVNLSSLIMIVGANNAGKTSFLKALHLALGIDRRIVTKEDIHDDGQIDPSTLEIVIDLRIIPVDNAGLRVNEFEDLWAESDDLSSFIKSDSDSKQFLAFRTRYKFDSLIQTYKAEVKLLKQWLPFGNWQDRTQEDSYSKPKAISLIFIDAQRDIQNDLKDRSSFLGKLTNKPKINQTVIGEIEEKINLLNEEIISNSETLNHLREKLNELNKVVNAQGDGVEIMPLNRKLNDIGRNLNIYFKDTNSQSFPLEYHGMGTRSWASLLTLSAYISWMTEENNPYYPILALEEPEAHLHPNGQRQLYHQMIEITGQKIISTHSPFVAAQCDLMNLRHFYKDESGLKVGQLHFSEPDEIKIGELLQEIANRGNTPEANIELRPIIQTLLNSKATKLNAEEKRKIERSILNTRGESLFSKVLVFFEGETEEQALPIFAKEKFGKHSFELGINFVGVGGKDQYKPFLNFAKFLNIKWYILSDGDYNTENEVTNQIRETVGLTYIQNLFTLVGVDFEGYLVANGYTDEILIAINTIERKENYLREYIQRHNGQPRGGTDSNGNQILRNYVGENGNKDALLDMMRGDKTKYAAETAKQICNKKDASGKAILPPKIVELFNKIASDLNITLP